MRPQEIRLGETLRNRLLAFDRDHTPLPGIQPHENLLTLTEQIIESIRRIRYVNTIRTQQQQNRISPARMDPNRDCFDPLRASLQYCANGNFDEACWLVFLATHFGKHHRTGWNLTRLIYGQGGGSENWTWSFTRNNVPLFRTWLSENEMALRTHLHAGAFGNHRKYESIKDGANGTGAVVQSYVEWINSNGSHTELINSVRQDTGGDPKTMFGELYRKMNVHRFGRTAKFDYLTMLGKLGLAAIIPNSAYLVGSTGPLRGAKLLFGGSTTARLDTTFLDQKLVDLDAELDVGMQVLEDSICNWQKSPGSFRPFRG